jgi:hypothetical protein
MPVSLPLYHAKAALLFFPCGAVLKRFRLCCIIEIWTYYFPHGWSAGVEKRDKVVRVQLSSKNLGRRKEKKI